MRFKNLEERESPKKTISTSNGLEPLQIVLEPDTGWCASEEAKPRRGWTWGCVPARTLGPKWGWIGGSHIDWRRKQVLARTLGPEGGGLWDPTSVGEDNETFFIRVWKPLTSGHVLKTLRESPKRTISNF